jgi:DNA-binding HxlR family transcriptional regulator
MAKRQLQAKLIVKDINDGLNDSQLMEKYTLTPKQLEQVLRQLLDQDLITHMQLYERTQLSDTQITKAFMDTADAIRELD